MNLSVTHTHIFQTNQNPIRIHDCIESVCNSEYRTIHKLFPDCFLNDPISPTLTQQQNESFRLSKLKLPTLDLHWL